MRIGDGFDLTYCGNVHAPDSLERLLENLRSYAGPLRRRLDPEEKRGPAGVGLYFGATLTAELMTSAEARDRIRHTLEEEGLFALTVNAFPYGDFHAERVKKDVYRPTWGEPSRLDYTLDTARLLASLPHAGRELSISTLPAGYGPLEGEERGRVVDQLGRAAEGLAEIEATTGVTIRLGIEPEPGCAFERIAPLLDFLADEVFVGPESDLRRRYLGVCLDVCHQAVEFEDLSRCLDAIVERDVALPKIQVSSALSVLAPGRNEAARRALRPFDEPRYLHQVFARSHAGRRQYFEDLGAYLACAELRNDAEIRCHFHVPVHRESYGPLGTTRSDLEELLDRVRQSPLRPHLEVETYTWDVLPKAEDGVESSLLDDLELELRWVLERIEAPSA